MTLGDDARTLLRLARAITDPARPKHTLIREVVTLRELLERRSGLTPDSGADLGAGQTALDTGLAISPLKAALCARECFRTIVFIKGLHAAIEEAGRTGLPVRVLYAGCGPFATLALPLMALLAPEQAVFTLLDIHPDSLAHARRLVDSFGLAGRVAGYVHADATRYRIGGAAPPHVIVSETMNAALRGEPQVSIARHLAAQAPHAVLVPACVTVRACLLHLAKEFAAPLSAPDAMPVEPERDRIDLGVVFELSTDSVRAWAGLGDTLPAGEVEIVLPLAQRYRAMLLTHIRVHGAHVLDDYDSSLNLPQPFPGKPALRGGERLRFRYRAGARPGLELAPD